MFRRRKTANWRIVPGGAEIELTQGAWSLIDVEDINRIAAHKWYAAWSRKTKSYVAMGHIDGHTCRMARLIMNAPPGLVVDHINHDTLDNRKANLRVCTLVENARNVSVRQRNKTSIYKGVSWNRRLSKWQAYIQIIHRHLYLGSFSLEVDAARAYNDAAVKHFGEFACLNEIPGP